MSDLDRLREVGQLVRQPAFDELLETRSRRARRAHLATATTLAVAGIAVVGVLAATGGNVRTDAPPVAPSPTPTPSETLAVPAGQQTIMPDIGPGDISVLAVLATMTNGQPEHRNDTMLTATVTNRADVLNVSSYCRSHDVPTWIAYADGDLVGDPDQPGAGIDWGWRYSKCLPGDPTTFEPPGIGIYEETVGAESRTVRMVAIAPPSGELKACLAARQEPCPLPEPITATDAEFGFRVYEWTSAPWVLELFEDQGNGEPWQFKALSSINGVGWLVDRAVVAAPDAHRLAFELPASGEYVVDVYVARGPHTDRCLAQHADEIPESGGRIAQATAENKVCGVDLRLVVDGTAIAPRDVNGHGTDHFSDLGARLSPGTDHQVEVKVVRGDPRNIRYAVVVRVRTEMP